MLSNKNYEIKYNCVFSNSLLMDKCLENSMKITKQGATKDVIKVGFDYGYTDWDLKNEIEDIKLVNSWLKKHINKNNKEEYKKTIQMNVKKIKELSKNNYIKKDVIREILYNNGFSIDIYKTVKGERRFDRKIKYVFFYRTAGQAKQGGDYFINEKILKKIDDWFRMGIKIKKDNYYDMVGFEVYKSLVSSAIEDYFVCKPNEILIVKDLDCYSDLQNIIRVQRNKDTGYSEAKHTKQKCKNTIWDGMALVQTENGSTGFRGLRHLFFKAGGFIADFQKYFKKYYGDKYETATVKDIFGRNVLIKDIKMITTENAIKWVKYLGISKESFEHWAKYLEMNGCKFGICKRDHKSKYGTKQRMSYQMINTLPIGKKDIKKIFKDTNDFVNKLQNDNEFFLEHLKRTKNDMNNNELLIDLVTHYPTFVNSNYFKENRKQEIKKYKNTLYNGKILLEGDNETIVGNPFLLLKYVTGQLDKYINNGIISEVIDESLPNKNSCYCKRFKYGKTLGCFRSPHNSPNNIMVFYNDYNENIMEEYFYTLGDNTIAVNFLYNDIQDRGNGLDTDLDFVYTTDNETLVKACMKALSFPTIINGFEKESKKYKYTMGNLAIVDNNLQSSQKAIGTSSNVAQLYLSQYWDMTNKGKYKEAEKLLDNVCILSVLAQVAVDSSKRRFIVGENGDDLNKEIERLRNELPNKQKPLFWQYVSESYMKKNIEIRLKNTKSSNWRCLNAKERKNKVIEEQKHMINKLKKYNCPMNMIIEEIGLIKRGKRIKGIGDNEFIVLHGNSKNRDTKQAKKIDLLIEEFDNKCKNINYDLSIDEEDKDNFINILYEEYIHKIKKLKININTMSLMINRTLGDNNKIKNNSNLKTKMLNILYNNNKDIFIKCFKNSKN